MVICNEYVNVTGYGSQQDQIRIIANRILKAEIKARRRRPA